MRLRTSACQAICNAWDGQVKEASREHSRATEARCGGGLAWGIAGGAHPGTLAALRSGVQACSTSKDGSLTTIGFLVMTIPRDQIREI